MPKNRYTIIPDIKGEIIGVRKVQDRGRLQVPREVRDSIGLEEGDSVYWLRGLDGRFYIAKAVELR